jgi:hypothetical protein
MKKLIVILVLLVSATAGADTLSDLVAKAIKENASEMPQMIDEDLRWDNIEVDGRVVRYYFTFVSLDAKDVQDIKPLLNEFKKAACAAEGVRGILDMGFFPECFYSDMHGVPLGDFKISCDICGGCK